MVLSALLIAAFWWWFGSDLPLTAVYLLLSVLAVISVPLLYRLTGYTLADEMEWLENREADEHAEMIQRLRSIRGELVALDVPEGVRQADMLSGILDDYHSVVETRFIGKKHSPMAYLPVARKVQKHAVQNLNDVVAVGHSLSSIDRNTSQGDDEQRASRQAGLQTDQSARMQNLLDENQKLFDALTDTAIEVANIKSFSKFDRIDTLARLESLAEIANQTGK